MRFAAAGDVPDDEMKGVLRYICLRNVMSHLNCIFYQYYILSSALSRRVPYFYLLFIYLFSLSNVGNFYNFLFFIRRESVAITSKFNNENLKPT